jgi:AcrR family transcriptional regulator
MCNGDMQVTSHHLPRKAKGHGGERREEILAQTLRLISDAGVHNVSTRQIAQAVGISQPTLYAYFPNRHALIGEVAMRAFAALAGQMRQAADAAGSAEDRLKAVARTYVAFGLEQPDAYRVAFMIEALGNEEKAADDPSLNAGFATFIIHRQCVVGFLPDDCGEDEVTLVAQSMWASLHGLVSLLIARPGFPWAEQAALIDRHIAAMTRGYGGRDCR